MSDTGRCRALPFVLLSVLLACSATRPDGSDQGQSRRGGSGAKAAGVQAGHDTATAGVVGSAGAGGTSGGAAEGSAGATAGGAAGSEFMIDIADVPDAQTLAMAEACSVGDTTSVHGLCEDDVTSGQVGCRRNVLYDECTYFQFAPDDVSHEGSPISVCRQRCVVLETSPFWTGSCESCTRTCPPPQPGVFVHELDIGDCLARPPTPCVVDFGTEQANLDATLGALINEEAGWGPVRNGSVEIALEHGCVKRYYASGAAIIPNDTELFDAALAGARFACAEQLSCAHIQGGDTLATQ